MLFRREVLSRIASGEVTAALRRWRRPTVHAGGCLTTAVGVLAIDAVEPIDPAALSDSDARRTGCASAAEALADLRPSAGGDETLVLVRFHLAGPDPRAEARTSVPGQTEIARIVEELRRLDGRRSAPWTRALMETIAANDGVAAARLAMVQGREKSAFKADVRRLKALGLTESLPVGYRLSPRGRAVLEAWPTG